MQLFELKDNSGIYLAQNALSPEQCDMIVEAYEEHDHLHYQGVVGGGLNTDVKNTIDISVDKVDKTKYPVFAEIDKILYENLAESMEQLAEIINGKSNTAETVPPFVVEKDYGYLIQVYSPGGHYCWHHDGDVTAARTTTALWYLNSVPVSAGGRTCFQSQDIQVQPHKGDLIIFPAGWSHIHKAEHLNFGKKYIATTWLA